MSDGVVGDGDVVLVEAGEVSGLDRVLDEMRSELERNFSSLKMVHHESIVPHYLAYYFSTSEDISLKGDLGSCKTMKRRSGSLSVEMRVRSTKGRTMGRDYDHKVFFDSPSEGSARVELWRMTDDVFKDAVRDYLAEKRRSMFTPSGRREKALCFLDRPPVEYVREEASHGIDIPHVEDIVKRCTSFFRDDPRLTGSVVEFNAAVNRDVRVDSEGSVFVGGSRFYSIFMSADALSESSNHKVAGQPVAVVRQFYFSRPEDMPSDEALLSETRTMLEELDDVIVAPVQEPVDVPAVLDPDLSAQLLYSIVSGSLVNRCSDLSFVDRNAYRKGDRLFPDYITIEDVPGEEVFVDCDGVEKGLNGHCDFDDFGVPSERLTLVDSGKVAGFPCSRDYVPSVGMPNGRGHMGSDVTLGITNMFVRSSNEVDRHSLLDRLLSECDAGGHDYGLFLVGARDCDIDSDENFYTLTPRLAYRVWAKDCKDADTGKDFRRGDVQMVRGVQVVGNPEMTLGNLLCTGDDYRVTVPLGVDNVPGVYSGEDSCVVSPSLVFSRIELKKEFSGKTRPVIVPHPFAGSAGGGDGR